MRQTAPAARSDDVRLVDWLSLSRKVSYCGTPSTATRLYFANFSPTFRIASYSGECRQAFNASMLSHRRTTTRPLGNYPSICVPCPAAT